MATSTIFDSLEIADRYARHRDVTDEAFMDVVASVLPAGGRVADVGAGCGAPAEALRRRGHDVVAVEPSPAMVARGRDRHVRVPFVRGTGEDLPLGSASCGSAVLLYVLHHVEDPERVLAECRRVVRPGGRVVAVTGNTACSRQRLFAGYFPTLVPDLPDADEVALYGRAAGLSVADVVTVPHWPYPNRVIDDAYVEMVSTEMFSPLRELNPIEFTDGVVRLKRDLGLPLPPAEASLVVFDRA